MLIIPDPGRGRITRRYIQLHKHIIFIYGDTLHRDGNGKQAREAKGEPNAFSVPVKKFKCYNDVSSFFNDQEFDVINKNFIDKSLHAIPKSNDFYIILPKIGQGYNEMPTRAPKTYAYLMRELFRIFGRNKALEI